MRPGSAPPGLARPVSEAGVCTPGRARPVSQAGVCTPGLARPEQLARLFVWPWPAQLARPDVHTSEVRAAMGVENSS